MKLFSFYRDLEEDPLFGDDLSPDNRLSGSDWLSSSPPQSPDSSKSDGKTEVHKIVNRWTVCLLRNTLCSFEVKLKFWLLHSYDYSFLCLVPDEAKSSYHVEGTGYDTYLRDAHRQVNLYSVLCCKMPETYIKKIKFY